MEYGFILHISGQRNMAASFNPYSAGTDFSRQNRTLDSDD